MFVIGKSFRHTLPSELQRCKLGRFFEFFHKMSEIIEPAFQTDLRDGQFGRAQQRCRMLDAKVIDIGNGCFAEGFFEKNGRSTAHSFRQVQPVLQEKADAGSFGGYN